MSGNEHSLPSSWSFARVRELGEVTLGRQRAPKHAHGAHMRPYLRVANVHESRIDTSDVLQMNFTPAEFLTYALKPGDVLLNEGQSLELVGRAAIYRGEVPGACFQNTLVRFRAGFAVVPAYAHWLFNYFMHRGDFRRIARWTTNIAHLGAGRFAEVEVPVAPVSEQRRIVAAIESYFSRLDDAVATLERVQRNLERYRASVLKDAVEGRLVPTEAELARKEGRTYEPASELLKRILAERRRRWEEAEFAKLKAKGQTPKDNRWKAKCEEPAAPAADGLPSLPVGWCWATVEQVLEILDSFRRPVNASERAGRVGTVPYFGATGQVGWIDDYIFDEELILLGEDGAPFLDWNRPKAYVIRGRTWVNNHAHVLRAPSETPSLFWKYQLDQLDYHEFVNGTTRLKLPQGPMKTMLLAIPPLAEQVRITQTLERLISIADAMSQSITQILERVSKARQSVLAWAFSGRLVDQDPTDEPASVLFDRIRAERAPATPATATRVRRRKEPIR